MPALTAEFHPYDNVTAGGRLSIRTIGANVAILPNGRDFAIENVQSVDISILASRLFELAQSADQEEIERHEKWVDQQQPAETHERYGSA